MLKMFVIVNFKKGKHPLSKIGQYWPYYPTNFHHQFQNKQSTSWGVKTMDFSIITYV